MHIIVSALYYAVFFRKGTSHIVLIMYNINEEQPRVSNLFLSPIGFGQFLTFIIHLKFLTESLHLPFS